MKIQLLGLALLLPCMLKAQDCLSQKDPITGKLVKTGTVIINGDSTQSPVQFVIFNSEEDLSIGVSWISALAVSNFDESSMKLSIKFENGVVKDFSANSSTKVRALGSSAVVAFRAAITKEDLDYLHANPISELTLKYKGDSGPGSSFPVSGLHAAKIRNSIICFGN